ncbi:MAG: TraB/GumN family protein [Prevotella sp.]|nr:TraB/GumN family protein [Prevotella sp.]
MRKTVVVALLCWLASAVSAQLLYRVSGNGLQKSSYILGTYHFAPITMVDSIPGLHQALESVGQVYGELEEVLDITTASDAATMQKMMQAMMMPDSVKLSSLIDPYHYQGIDSLLKSTLGLTMMMAEMSHLSPIALSTMLEVALTLQQQPDFNPEQQFDGYFLRYARDKGMPAKGLETVDEQIAIMYKGMSLERQAQLLMCLYDNLPSQKKMTDGVLTAYFSQDLERLEQAMDEKTGTYCDNTPEEENRLIYDRNARWVEQMPAIMAEKPTFFAVGAGHLPGERGVLQMLRRAGFTVNGVKP